MPRIANEVAGICIAFDAVNESKVGHIQRFLDLDDQWNERGDPPVAPRSWSVDPDTYRAAFHKYDQWFWETAEKLGIGPPKRTR